MLGGVRRTLMQDLEHLPKPDHVDRIRGGHK
jgi:hypothetical protein